jgi:hypothetical protein
MNGAILAASLISSDDAFFYHKSTTVLFRQKAIDFSSPAIETIIPGHIH